MCYATSQAQHVGQVYASCNRLLVQGQVYPRHVPCVPEGRRLPGPQVRTRRRPARSLLRPACRSISTLRVRAGHGGASVGSGRAAVNTEHGGNENSPRVSTRRT